MNTSHIFIGQALHKYCEVSLCSQSTSSLRRSSTAAVRKGEKFSIMSDCVETATADMMCFASCGKAQVDDVKLKACAWLSVIVALTLTVRKIIVCSTKRYARKRAAEIRDDRLFRQPDESYLGECPICCLPLPLEMKKATLMSCCCKRICIGCDHANKQREREEGLVHKCVFCREPIPKTQEQMEQNEMKRIKANDPYVLCKLGNRCHREGDYGKAFEYWTEAAALGNMSAHYYLSILYMKGEGVEKDTKKEVYHLEVAAIGGHPEARYNLGVLEHESGRIDRAMKHYIIAAKLGDEKSMEELREYYTDGNITKDDLETTRRTHKAAIDAMKSPQREEAYSKWE